MSNRTLLSFELATPIEDDRPVYLAGNFCDWYPDLSEFEMEKVSKGKYKFSFSPDKKLPETIEYKYTRGGWDFVELDSYGNSSANRIVSKKQGSIKDFVPFWRQDGSTASVPKLMPKVQVVAEEFAIPQLGKTRAIHILLPHDYDKQTDKRYPVLYMQDAQNLFGEGSGYGNWEIDKRLSLLAKQGKADLIVVAIDHGDKDRFREYSPYTVEKKGKGLGMKYANFIVRTLKPYIDANFRTKPEAQFTGIGGSSMGGLISLYAGLMYPETIGRLMVFSPSLWVSDKIYFDITEFFSPVSSKIYLYGGGKESATMIPGIRRIKETIGSQHWDNSKIDVKLSLDSKGEHSEKRWGQEFSKAVEWLFY
ncbi:alpha/beta hydrolase [Emticicia sp. 17c]|uniref:alpha/beta hydrolase n=1 Tax=Emticicia sp. 17c TaxID=3127704 RepID=UPI00301C1799